MSLGNAPSLFPPGRPFPLIRIIETTPARQETRHRSLLGQRLMELLEAARLTIVAPLVGPCDG